MTDSLIQVCESYNNVFGHTMNPYNLSLSSGGSSSGEGAIVGIRGALLGVGSDIGGSVRIPALFNGTYGFKPTQNRLPYGGQQELLPKGWPGPAPTLGPLAVSSEDLTLFMKTLLLAKPWIRDSTALAVSWRHVPSLSQLRIGVFQEDPLYPVLPPVQRAQHNAVEKLEAAGHQIIILKECPSLYQAAKIISRGFSLDKSNTALRHLAEAGEKPILPLTKMSEAADLEDRDEIGLDDVWRFRAEREDYREQWGKLWRKNSLDILLCPGYQGVGARHDHVGFPHYTAVWNLLDVSSIKGSSSCSIYGHYPCVYNQLISV
jgi:amidase